jgi:hypothetical protein
MINRVTVAANLSRCDALRHSLRWPRPAPGPSTLPAQGMSEASHEHSPSRPLGRCCQSRKESIHATAVHAAMLMVACSHAIHAAMLPCSCCHAHAVMLPCHSCCHAHAVMLPCHTCCHPRPCCWTCLWMFLSFDAEHFRWEERCMHSWSHPAPMGGAYTMTESSAPAEQTVYEPVSSESS